MLLQTEDHDNEGCEGVIFGSFTQTETKMIHLLLQISRCMNYYYRLYALKSSTHFDEIYPLELINGFPVTRLKSEGSLIVHDDDDDDESNVSGSNLRIYGSMEFIWVSS